MPMYRPAPHQPDRRIARRLGWFSLGLGVAEVLLPRTLARLTGLTGQERLLQWYGAREIANGLALLLARNPEPMVWARVAGDALDAATLAPSVAGANGQSERLPAAVALGAVAGVAAMDIAAAARLRRDRLAAAEAVGRPDYRDRSGFPRPPAQMRGVATRDFQPPADLRVPEALRPQSTAPKLRAGGAPPTEVHH
ncbi:hypothetical protein [Aquabacterium sp. J223]|uniref:hypothetical protein n=1 Tax=Aquabacterium sp. J223 TaxID=2898431 RepID=UPI0021ADA704|nr:hypothetical protein [Aquabacterium sp. J223]UUX96752.1 hypothetical protein LRS07_05570 [Aquabacterium sp. J223]